jgi:hypothetical protein
VVIVPATETIFLRAQQAWIQRVTPRYESFRILCAQTFLDDKCNAGDVVEFTVRQSDGRTFAQTVATTTAPSHVLLRGGYIYGPDGTPLGFYRALPAQPGGALSLPPPNMAPDPLLPTIAVTSTIVQAYDIGLGRDERIGTYDCYHLLLRPVTDPARFALRELFVDKVSGNVVQLSYAHDFGNGKWGTVEYRFAPIGSQRVWSIVHISANAPAGSFFGSHAQTVSSELQDIAFPRAVPDADFKP